MKMTYITNILNIEISLALCHAKWGFTFQESWFEVCFNDVLSVVQVHLEQTKDNVIFSWEEFVEHVVRWRPSS